jgi:hypothetical protein
MHGQRVPILPTGVTKPSASAPPPRTNPLALRSFESISSSFSAQHPTFPLERVVHYLIQTIRRGDIMSKERKDVPELTDEEVAFEMLEITCDEMNSLAKAFEMISNLCKELNGEEVEHTEEQEGRPEEINLH